MIRILPFAIEAILLVFCLIDCILADDARVRNLPKWAWILLVIVVPLVGGIGWLVAGRPLNTPASTPPRRRTGAGEWEQPPAVRTKAPDDDPEFLASLKRSTDRERKLKQWEDDLRRREEDLRHKEDAGPDPDPEPKPDDR
jgi:hypothetical protein